MKIATNETSTGFLMQYSKFKYIATRIFLHKILLIYIKERNRVTRRFECINREFKIEHYG